MSKHIDIAISLSSNRSVSREHNLHLCIADSTPISPPFARSLSLPHYRKDLLSSGTIELPDLHFVVWLLPQIPTISSAHINNSQLKVCEMAHLYMTVVHKLLECTLYIVRRTLYTVQCKSYSVQGML